MKSGYDIIGLFTAPFTLPGPHNVVNKTYGKS